MTPEYYGNLYRRYQTYIRNYAGNDGIAKICCGANSDDYHWTEEVMKTTFDHAPKHSHGFMDGLSLHYYTVPGPWEHKGSAAKFDENEWFITLSKAYFMDEIIRKHSAIMDQYDPEKEIGLMIDEWGCWFDVEPGTNPGFLYQQNTMRDALTACISLNIFNKHCDRVKMANIAQLVNVLQSVILTEGTKMLLTPTYYVFRMYKYHQNAQLLDSLLETNEIGTENYKVPAVSESVSMSEDGAIHITLGNLSPSAPEEMEIQFYEQKPIRVTGSILTGSMTAHNTFEQPDVVNEQAFNTYSITGQNIIQLTLPPCSVLHLEIRG